jgi:hypothetical protein
MKYNGVDEPISPSTSISTRQTAPDPAMMSSPNRVTLLRLRDQCQDNHRVSGCRPLCTLAESELIATVCLLTRPWQMGSARPVRVPCAPGPRGPRTLREK